jgi:adenylate cyclase
MGFGVGIAIGPAAVGTIGYEGRIDYTANGNVVNLASRLCCGVDDTPMLVDAVVAKRVKQRSRLCPSESGPSKATIIHCRSLPLSAARLQFGIPIVDGACRD